MLAADIQYETLARSLLIAVVLVTPYGIYKVRQVRALRRELRAQVAAATAPPEPPGPQRPKLEDVIDEIHRIAQQGGADATVTVPTDVTVGGRDPAVGTVDVLVRDALRRSGLVATAEIDTPAGRVIEVHRPTG